MSLYLGLVWKLIHTTLLTHSHCPLQLTDCTLKGLCPVVKALKMVHFVPSSNHCTAKVDISISNQYLIKSRYSILYSSSSLKSLQYSSSLKNVWKVRHHCVLLLPVIPGDTCSYFLFSLVNTLRERNKQSPASHNFTMLCCWHASFYRANSKLVKTQTRSLILSNFQQNLMRCFHQKTIIHLVFLGFSGPFDDFFNLTKLS